MKTEAIRIALYHYETHTLGSNAATKELGALLAELARLTAENSTFRTVIKDIFDDMPCLEKCDSYGHEEGCPVVEQQSAFRVLREEKARLTRENEELRKAMNVLKRYSHSGQCGMIVTCGVRPCDCPKGVVDAYFKTMEEKPQ